MREYSSNTIIIGGGPAGLAVGACLHRADVPFIILEESDKIASSWHNHYKRLHLHTDKTHSQLPYFPYPKTYPKYPSRKQFIRYLDNYSKNFHLDPLFGQKVLSVNFNDEAWETKTKDSRYRSRNLVVATGYNREPFYPQWPGQNTFEGSILHSSQYKKGQKFKGQKVLVVGFGNSGGEIALDLCEQGVKTEISVRSPVNIIPRDLFGIPILTISAIASKLPTRLADALTAPFIYVIYGNLNRLGLDKLPYGPFTQIKNDARIPLIDIGAIALIKKGHIKMRSAIDRFKGNKVCFNDGKQESYDTVILATGYHPRVDTFLQKADGLLDRDGTPSKSGTETTPGLYFCGFCVSPTGILNEIAKEAKQIAETIKQNHHS